MKNCFYLLAAFMVASFSSIAQKVVVIDYDLNHLSKITASADLGNLMPLDEEKSMVNFGFADLAIINNQTGKVLQQFDESIIEAKFNKFLQENYKGTYVLFGKEELAKLPYCQRHSFIYRRFYPITGEAFFACEVTCVVKNLLKHGQAEELSIVVFIDKNLNLLSLFERDDYPNSYLSSTMGGFFLDKENFFIKKAVPEPSEKIDFIHFQLEGKRFCLRGGLTLIDAASKMNYFPGRHLSMTKFDDDIYVNNGKNLIKTSDLFKSKGDEIDMRLQENELVTVLKKIGEKEFAGIKIDIDDEGAALLATLFKANLGFSKINKIKAYDQRTIRINSMETLGDKAYLFLFDRDHDQYLLEVKKI